VVGRIRFATVVRPYEIDAEGRHGVDPYEMVRSSADPVGGGGAARGGDDAGFDDFLFKEALEDQVDVSGFGATEGVEKVGAGEPTVVVGSASEGANDPGAERGEGRVERAAFADQRDRAVNVDADVLDDLDRAAHGVASEGSAGIVRVPEGVDDEGDVSEVAGHLPVEATEDKRGDHGEIDMVGEPLCPGGSGIRGVRNGKTGDDAVGGGNGAERAKQIEHRRQIRRGGGILIPGRHDAGDEGKEEAFKEAILFLAADFGKERWLEAADDADDGIGQVAGGIGTSGEKRFRGPEGQIVLAILAATAIHGANETVEFVPKEAETGGIGEGGGEAGEGSAGGEEAIESGAVGAGFGSDLPGGKFGSPLGPGFVMKLVEGFTGGGDG